MIEITLFLMLSSLTILNFGTNTYIFLILLCKYIIYKHIIFILCIHCNMQLL